MALMSARRVLCRLAIDVPKTTTHDLPRLARLVQRAILDRNVTSPASLYALSRAYKLGHSFSRRSYATAGTKATSTVKKDVKKAAAKKRTPMKKISTKGTTATKKKATSARKKAPTRKVKAKESKSTGRPKKKPLTVEEKEKAVIKNLKAQALREPNSRGQTAWIAYAAEYRKANNIKDPISTNTEAARRFKALTPAEKEHYNHIANQSKAATQAAYKAWVESHTPDQIRVANLARLNLRRRLAPKKGATKRANPPHTRKIADDRQVRKPASPYSLFYQERQATGDMKGIPVSERTKLAASEWKVLSASEKKKYEDEHAAQYAKYRNDFEKTYGYKINTTAKT